MIIDARFNSGGFDELALIIASYFTEQTLLAYSKENYNHGEPGIRTQYYVEPNPYVTYTNPITLITGPDTASAAEILTMASLLKSGRRPGCGDAKCSIWN